MSNNDIQKLLQEAQNLQSKVQKAQDDMASKTFPGQAGTGDHKVAVIMGGDGKVQAARVSEGLMNLESKEMLEDLIVAALNNAKGSLEVAMQDIMKDMGLPMDMLKGDKG